MKCVILQPSYIPWRAYFHQIFKADLFVFYDDVQYDKRGWRNRNQIKTSAGLQWLTIPVHSKGAQTKKILIRDIPIMWEQQWNKTHLNTIKHAYSKAPHFNKYFILLEKYYEQNPELLVDFITGLTMTISRWIGINDTQFIRSSTLSVTGEKTDRLINILNCLGASHYITGPSAKDYLDESKFDENNIVLEYMKYNYSEYPQLFPPFEPNVSILDLLFMTGENALDFITTEVT